MKHKIKGTKKNNQMKLLKINIVTHKISSLGGIGLATAEEIFFNKKI